MMMLLHVILALVVSIPTTSGHGLLLSPPARSPTLPGCGHCLSAGGPQTVKSNTPGGIWPAVPTEANSVRWD